MEIDSLSLILLFLIVLFTFLSIRDAPSPDVHPLLLASQSDVARVRYPGETAIHASSKSHQNLSFLLAPNKNVKTTVDLFQNGVAQGNRFLGHRLATGSYSWVKHVYPCSEIAKNKLNEVAERIKFFGSGLLNFAGLSTEKRDLVGIFLKNRPAAHHYNLVSVAFPSHRILLQDLISSINLTQVTTVVVSSDTLQIILSAAPSSLSLKYLILTEKTVNSDTFQKVEALGLQLKTFDDIEKLGQQNIINFVPPGPDDIASIFFTNGTTGEPKGIELTHMNIVSGVAGILAITPTSQKLTPTDIYLSYLPLAQIFERTVFGALLFTGGAIAFGRGETSKVLEDAQEVKPTIFTSTPQFLNELQESITSDNSNRLLFKRAYNSKLRSLRKGRLMLNSLWDVLIFNNIKAKLGGQVRVIITSWSPLSQTTLDFLRIVFSCQVVQVYGLTECSGTIAANSFYDYQPIDQKSPNETNVGPPLPCNEIKLVNCDEQACTVEDQPNPRGEIYVRGPNVMQGYHRRPEETAKKIDSDGWFHTGDIGIIFPNGTLKIHARKLLCV
ncbi:hypothetical protein G9A89_009268 [Geosiphon pyriformis]|nr:hypothetical protein G9A89_009268 [Geosiphon pyriformis]